MPTRPRRHAVLSRNWDHLWCPGVDSDMSHLARDYIRDFQLFPSMLQGGKVQLGDFDPKSKLYILCHGHKHTPLFKVGQDTWNSQKLAELLHSDGLPLDQREIELLVCHAGESVNTESHASKLMGVRRRWADSKEVGNQRAVAKLARKYKREEARSRKPTFFKEDPERLLLPLAALFTQHLKKLGYTNFQVISYKCAVAQRTFEGKVYLDLSEKGGQWSERVSDNGNEKYRVVWR